MYLYYIHLFYFVSILILMAHSSLSVQSLKNLENNNNKKRHSWNFGSNTLLLMNSLHMLYKHYLCIKQVLC